MRQFSSVSLVLGLLGGALSCSSMPAPPTVETFPGPPASPAPVNEVSLAEVGLSAEAIDRSVDPCQDFYRFACGGWMDKTEIPSDKPRWVRSFSEIHKSNEQELLRILEESRKLAPSSGARGRLGAYYGACVDEAAIEAQGLAPLEPLMKEIAKVRDAKTLTEAVMQLHRRRVWALFDISADQDFKDATKVIAHLDQSGLGLPDRDYYVVDDEDKKKIRAAYLEHVQKMLVLAGNKEARAKKMAADVLEIETELAKVSKTKVERRDPKGLYNKIDRSGLESTVGNFDWKRYFDGIGRPKLTDISVTAPKFFEGMNALVKKVRPAQWKSYLTWHVVHSLAPALGHKLVHEDFRMRQVLSGQPEMRPRWKRCVAATDEAMGEQLAQPYIEKRFAGKSKEAAQVLIHEISRAFDQRLDELDWMDDKTRARAREKLQKMAFLIGYPSKYKQYDFEIGPDSYAKNLMAARAWELSDNLSRLDRPVDREEWEMSPPTVNAYYHPLKNQMVFPAGILQPPFYSVDAKVAVNLGAMGMVVGHELTHGFDDQGAQFDADGNLRDWWEPKVSATFKSKTGCVEKLYSGFELLPGLKQNGELTLGENIADMGGIKLAFRAYRSIREGQVPNVAEGFTEDQQFFLATGQSWCALARDEFIRLATQNDPHSQPRNRINGPMSQLPEFAEAFSCASGTPMHPEKVCSVW